MIVNKMPQLHFALASDPICDIPQLALAVSRLAGTTIRCSADVLGIRFSMLAVSFHPADIKAFARLE